MKKLFIFYISICLLGNMLMGQDKAPVSSITEGFENDPCIPDTWIMKSDIASTWICDNSAKKTGVKSISWTPKRDDSQAIEGEQGPVVPGYSYLLLPLLDMTAVDRPLLTFEYQIGGNTWQTSTLSVYVSTTDTAWASFTQIGGDMLTASNGAWIKFSRSLGANVKYVIIRASHADDGGTGTIWIDDLFIGANPTPKPIPVTSINEGFEGDFPALNWSVETDRTDAKSLKKTTSVFHSGATAIEHESEWQGNKTTALTTPCLDLSQRTSPLLSFWYKNQDPLTSMGTTIYIYTSINGEDFTQQTTFRAGTVGQWERFVFSIDKSAAYVKMAIKTQELYGTSASTYIDDFFIGETPVDLCLSPKDFVVSSFKATSAELSWTSKGAATQWQINYGCPQNNYQLEFDPKAQMLFTNANPVTISGLMQDTTYHFRIRATCPTDTSSWTQVISQLLPATCPKPTNLVVSENTPLGFTLDWTEQSPGMQHILEISAPNFPSQTHLLSQNSYTANTLNHSTNYLVRLRAYCGVGDSSKWLSSPATTVCAIIDEKSFPWSNGFEGITVDKQVPNCMAISVHPTSPQWFAPVKTSTISVDYLNLFPHTGTKFAYFDGAEGVDGKGDDYIWTPAFNLKAGHAYTFSFWYAVTALPNDYSGSHGLEVRIGGQQSKDAMTKRIGDSIDLKDIASMDYKKYTAEFTPDIDGTYYLGIHGISSKQYASGYIAVDDLSLQRVFNCTDPINASVSDITNTTAELAWEDASNTTQWQIRYGKTDANVYVEDEQKYEIVNTTSGFTLTDLSPASQYAFQVRAICAEGDSSGWTLMEHFSTLANCPSPSQLIISDANSTGFKLSWTPGGKENKWDLSLREGRIDTALMPYYTSEVNTYTFTNLTASRYYTVHLRANCSTEEQSIWLVDTIATLCGTEALPYFESFEKIIQDGELPLCMSVTSDRVFTKTNFGGSLIPRTGDKFIYYIATLAAWIYTPAFNLEAGHEYEFFAFWMSADTINHLSLNYGVDKTEEDMNMIVEIGRSASKTGFTKIKGRFTPAVTGVYHLGIYGQSGANGTLTIDDISLKEVFSCEQASALKVRDITTQAARLQWTSTVDSFALSYRIKDSVNAAYTVVNLKDTVYTIENLRDNTEYIWKVQSICPFAKSEEIAGPIFRTLRILCEIPTETLTSNIGSDAATFTWKSEGNKFEVRYKTTTDTAYITEVLMNLKTFTPNLIGGTSYLWSVRNICNETYQSEWTNPLTFTTLDDPCASPIALNSEDISATSATLSWAGEAENFQVRYKKVSETEYNIQDVAAKKLALTNLSPKTPYVWEVRALCAAKDSSVWVDDKFTTESLDMETEENSKLSVYSNNAEIFIQNPTQIYLQKIEVVNISGQIVRTLLGVNDASIQISDIKPMGIYLLRLTFNNTFRSYKIIVK